MAETAGNDGLLNEYQIKLDSPRSNIHKINKQYECEDSTVQNPPYINR